MIPRIDQLLRRSVRFFSLVVRWKLKNINFCIFCYLKALADPYFKGLAKVEREPSCRGISKLDFEFEMRRVGKDDIRELLYREILKYHPQLLNDYMSGSEGTSFLYPRLG